VGEPFRHQLRVRYGECDAQGVVFNAHYLNYLDTSINELLRVACGSYRALLQRGIDLVVAEAALHFRAPAHFEELLTLEVAVVRFGRTSLSSEHRVTRDGQLLAEGTLRHVVVDRATLAKTPIPTWLRAELGPWAVGAAQDGGGGGGAG